LRAEAGTGDPAPGGRVRSLALASWACAVVAATAAGCAGPSPASPPAPTPLGPAARFRGPVTQGHIVEPASPTPVDLSAHGYVEQEFFASGVASAFRPEGPLGSDGKWSVRPVSPQPFKTRLVVRRPADPRRFNGTVLVEWLNVSGGLEASPDFSYLADQILRGGYAYVGVSAQALGVEGGPGILGVGPGGGAGLKAQEPRRYGTLHHPGDRYSYDIYAQVANGLWVSRQPAVLGPLRPKRVVAVGESQSGFYLTTFADAVQPVRHSFDAFFIHSRGGSAAPLEAGSILSARAVPAARIRDDLDVPVFVFETETDVGPLLDYGSARQPDTDRFRAWEVAGTAHADAYLVGSVAGQLGCKWSINQGPEHYVAVAALDALQRWLTEGRSPPRATPIELSSTSPPRVARDRLGNALGGVRTPAVDVPVATLSGEAPPGASPLCSLFGQTVPFSPETLRHLYGSRAAYLAAYRRDLDRTIRAGFLLGADRRSLLDEAERVSF